MCSQRVRLGLEEFESRVVPARIYWVGVAGSDASNPANWYDVKDDTTGVLPGANDIVIFGYNSDNYQYPSAVSTPCIGLTGTFGDFQIRDTYSGTVVFGGAVTMGAFLLAGGAISQPVAGTDLTVTSVFNWTGGTLNSSGTESTVYLVGATASINASAGVTLSTGDAFVLQSGASATVKASINFRFGSPVTIDASTMLIGADDPGAVTWSGPDGSYVDGRTQIELKSGGGLTVRSFDFDAKSRTFLNNGGHLTLEKGATATFGANAAPPAGTSLKVEILQNSGSITIGGGSTLTSTYGSMKVSDGSLFVDTGGTASTTGTIGCQLTFANGTIRILSGFGTLRVKKDFYWLGGVFQSTIDCVNNKSDQIASDGKFYIGGNATLQVFQLGFDPAVGLGNNFSRRILSATDGFVSVVANEDINITINNPQNGPQFQLSPSTLVAGGEVYNLTPAN